MTPAVVVYVAILYIGRRYLARSAEWRLYWPMAGAVTASTLPTLAQNASLVSPFEANIIGAVGSALAIGVAYWPIGSRSHPDRVDLAVGAFYAAGLLAWLLAGGGQSIVKTIGDWIIECTPALIALRLRHFASLQTMARITTAIGLGVIAASAVLAIFAEPLAYLDSSQALTPYSHGRLSGILGNPNNLGMICAFTAGVSSCIPLRRGKLAIPAICLYISIETGQRAAILATSLLFATLLFAGIARRLNARARPILVLTVAAIIVALGAPLQGLWNTILNERESSITGRYEVWSFVIKNGTEFLPIGLGPRGLYKMTSTIDMSEPFAHAHNQFLTWFTLSGIIAVVLAVVLLISWLSGTGSGHFSKSWGIALALTFPMLLESPLYTGFSVANLATATLGWVALAASLPVYRTQPSYA